VREVGNERCGRGEVISNAVEEADWERALRATVRADEMNVVVFTGVVILRSPFDVGVGQYSNLLEQLNGSIDG